MLNFVKWAFRSFFGILLWIVLVAYIIGGGVSGYIGAKTLDLFGDSSVMAIVGAAAGLIGGAIIGLILIIFFGGLIATFIEIGNDVSGIKAANAKIEADIAEIKKSASDMRTSTAETSAVFQKMANRQAPTANPPSQA